MTGTIFKRDENKIRISFGYLGLIGVLGRGAGAAESGFIN
jgi:hypothetical protein